MGHISCFSRTIVRPTEITCRPTAEEARFPEAFQKCLSRAKKPFPGAVTAVTRAPSFSCTNRVAISASSIICRKYGLPGQQRVVNVVRPARPRAEKYRLGRNQFGHRGSSGGIRLIRHLGFTQAAKIKRDHIIVRSRYFSISGQFSGFALPSSLKPQQNVPSFRRESL